MIAAARRSRRPAARCEFVGIAPSRPAVVRDATVRLRAHSCLRPATHSVGRAALHRRVPPRVTSRAVWSCLPGAGRDHLRRGIDGAACAARGRLPRATRSDARAGDARIWRARDDHCASHQSQHGHMATRHSCRTPHLHRQSLASP